MVTILKTEIAFKSTQIENLLYCYYLYIIIIFVIIIIIIIIIITSDTGIKVNFNYFTLYKASSLNLKII